MKKAAAVTIMFLALTSVFVFQHEWLHQDIAQEYGCEASQIQFPSITELDHYTPANLPLAYVTWNCEDPEAYNEVHRLQMINEIVGYQTLLTFLLAASILVFQFYHGHKIQESLNRVERTQAILIEKQGLQPGTAGENHRSS